MRLSRFAMLCLGVVTLGACNDDDEVTVPSRPPLASVRYINAVTDTGAVDLAMIDQIEFSAHHPGLAFRGGSLYYPTEAGVRHVRVFPTSRNIGVTTGVLHDAMITLAANSKYTLLLAGSARAGTIRLWVIPENFQTPAAGQIGVRMVNAGAAVSDGYLTATSTTAIGTTPTFSAVGAITASPYVYRTAGAVALRVTDAGQTTVTASAAGPSALAVLPGQNPSAGVNQAGSVFSAYYFPAGAAGSANAPVTAPSVIWFVDRNPCDSPPQAACIAVP